MLQLDPSAHQDSFARDSLPGAELWPEMNWATLGYAKRLNAAVGRKVGAINRVAILEKDAEAERLAFVGCDTEVHVEVAFGRGDP